ncbi:MAG: arginine deiminase-related protein [Bdellovibrionota bacterium]
MYPKHLLITEPIGYRIAYAINPHMVDVLGQLNVVDYQKSVDQWNKLKDLYVALGLTVHSIPGVEAHPDMVFCANQTFPFVNKKGEPCIVLSRMGSEFRQGEVPFYKNWADRNGIKTFELQDGRFEGCGDALWNYETGEVYGGYGFRTEKQIYSALEEIIERPIHTLHLKDDRFYHLDTCLVILNKNTAAYVPEAFTEDSLVSIRSKFSDLIRIELDEARHMFAGNAFCPDGKNVVLQKGADLFVKELRERSFKVHEMDTSEYMKSGGSVFCMKQLFWNLD